MSEFTDKARQEADSQSNEWLFDGGRTPSIHEYAIAGGSRWGFVAGAKWAPDYLDHADNENASGWGGIGDIPMYAMLDIWVALGRDSSEFEEWALDKGYALAWADLCWDVKVVSEKAWMYEELE